MKLFICLLAGSFPLAKTIAQPTTAQVQAHFKKGNVTLVDVKNTMKEWDSKKSKYYWKVSFVKTETVDPAEVDGLKGVTKLVHVVADYDLGSISPYWSGVTYSEYKGINLPTPSKEELLALLKKQGEADASKLVRSFSSKISFDNYIVDEPNTEWANPKKLRYDAKIIYKDQVNYTEFAVIESPVTVTLARSSIKDPWSFDFCYESFEKRKELSRGKLTELKTTTQAAVTTQPTEQKETPATPPATGTWKVGDKVLVEENGKWYPSTVLNTKPNEWFIHYDGYSAQYDLWVGIARIKNR